MKVLIRDIGTNLYMDASNWVPLEKARDFVTTAAAVDFCLEKKLGRIEIVHIFPEERYNFSTGVMDFQDKSTKQRPSSSGHLRP